MDFPPIAKDSFKTGKGKSDGEANAEGFRMTFDANGGRKYRIEINLPKHVSPGPTFVNFYASFYSRKSADSIVETGVSFSNAKHCNFFNNDHTKHPPEYRMGDGRKGQTLFMDVEFSSPQGGAGQITSTIQGHVLRAIRPYDAVDHMRVVIAVGNRKGAFFTKTGIFLRSIDGKPPVRPGFREFMAGSQVHGEKDAHSVLIQGTPNGMYASLATHPTLNQNWLENLD